MWAFVVIPHQADWLFNCWHLNSLDRSPQDVIIGQHQQAEVTVVGGGSKEPDINHRVFCFHCNSEV